MVVSKVLEQTLLPRHCVVLLLSDVGHMGFIEDKESTLNFLHGFISSVYHYSN
jgi:hypothetical protein